VVLKNLVTLKGHEKKKDVLIADMKKL
jgi:hypothetical protein